MAAQKIRRTIDDLLLLSAVGEEEDSDVETLLLDLVAKEPRPFQRSFRIDLENLDDQECINLFRFSKDDVHLLYDLLRVPEFYWCPNGTVVGGQESLLLLLRRLTYPNRLSDLCSLFGRPEPELSMIVHKVLDDIYNRYHHLLEDLDVDWITAQTFADAIHAAGAPLSNFWGLLMVPCDRAAGQFETKEFCSPVINVFMGSNFSVVCPNGLIAHLYRPIAGRHHDAFLLYESNLLPALRRKFPPPNIFTLYGDPAYPICQHILGPYRGAGLTPLQEQFNGNMSKVRESVEWGFGEIVQYFAFLDFSKNLKILLQPIGKYYVIGALFANCHTCLYGSTTTSLFGVPPPGIEEYLSN